MSAHIIDGRTISASLREEIKADVGQLQAEGMTPGLVVIMIGENAASLTYVKAKEKACQQLGIHSKVERLAEQSTLEELLAMIDEYNDNPLYHGILVQLPLPPQITEQAVIDRILPDKDVDGFHPVNLGKLVIGEQGFVPCTPHGILKMVQQSGCEIAGAHVVIVGRSNIVGKPAGLLFLREDATVTTCHSRTKNLAELTRSADILIVACGQPGFVGAEHVRQGAVVIDVGIHRTAEGKLTGDVRFDEVSLIADSISPVPGGVGPMTITMLLFNTVLSAKRQQQNMANRG